MKPTPTDAIRDRIEGLRAWLSQEAPGCTEQQMHLDEGSRERAYWHYGYLIALQDVERLLRGETARLHH